MPTAPALGGAFAGRKRRTGFAARQGLGQFGIETFCDHTDAVGAGFFGVVTV